MSINALMMPLSDGNDVPQFFSSAFRLGTVEATRAHVLALFKAGVRHFEIAELYGNGNTICETLREVASRDQVYIALKMWPKSRRAEVLRDTIPYLLNQYGLDYVDLLSVHAPIDSDNKVEQYKALEDAKDCGLTRSIGIVNINAVMLQDLLKNCRITPVTYEIESTPFGQNVDMVEFCGDSSIVVLNNAPLAKGLRNNHPRLVTLAEELGISPTRLLLKWAFTMRMAVGLPAGNAAVMTELDAGLDQCFDGPLSPHVMAELLSLEDGLVTTWVPTEVVVDDA
jgi:diketogulonate reductase-like aldo/keto reductase